MNTKRYLTVFLVVFAIGYILTVLVQMAKVKVHTCDTDKSETVVPAGPSTKLIIITPTYDRITQRADMIRLVNTLLHLKNILWIVVEDADYPTAVLREYLESTGMEFVHLAAKTLPKDQNPKGHRGVSQRNAALDYIRQNNVCHNAVVYFADDDNSYDLALFDYLRKSKTVGVLHVGLIPGPDGYIGPLIVQNGTEMKYGGKWVTFSSSSRVYKIDMASFSFNARYVCENPNLNFNYSWPTGSLEDEFLKVLAVPLNDLEILTDKVLAFHTKTILKPMRYNPAWRDRGVINATNPDDLKKLEQLLQPPKVPATPTGPTRTVKPTVPPTTPPTVPPNRPAQQNPTGPTRHPPLRQLAPNTPTKRN